MSKKFIIEDEAGAQEMAEGFQKNVNAYFNQNSYQGEVNRFDRDGVTVLVVRDVRDVVGA